MSCESSKVDDGMVSPRKRGLIHFNPKFSRQTTTNGTPADQSDSSSSSTFPKPRKYFDSADFFMREELKNHDSTGGQKKGEHHNLETTHRSSSLACECQTVGPSEGNSNSEPVNKNVVPLILLRRSKSSAVINSADGTDDAPESLPTTVEAINGPSNREIPSVQSSSSDEGTPTDSSSRSNSPVDKPQSPRTREEVRSLLIPRLTKTPAHDESSLAASASASSPRSSPLKALDEESESSEKL